MILISHFSNSNLQCSTPQYLLSPFPDYFPSTSLCLVDNTFPSLVPIFSLEFSSRSGGIFQWFIHSSIPFD